MNPDIIKQCIETQLQDSIALIEGDDGVHFSATVVSSQFIGKNRVQKQQLVYDALKTYLANGSLHAISIKTLTPEEWSKNNQDMR